MRPKIKNNKDLDISIIKIPKEEHLKFPQIPPQH